MFPEFGLVPLNLAVDFSAYEEDWRHVAIFRRRSGWLLMADATIQSQDHLMRDRIVVACTDDQEVIPSWRARHITQCPWSQLEHCDETPPDILDDLLCEEEGALFARWQRSSSNELAALHHQAQRKIERLEADVAIRHRRIDRQIADLRKRRRQTPDEAARAIFTDVLRQLEADSDALMAEWQDLRRTIRRSVDDLEESLWHDSDFLLEIEPVRLVHWRDGCPARDHHVGTVWIEGRFHAPPLSHPTPAKRATAAAIRANFPPDDPAPRQRQRKPIGVDRSDNAANTGKARTAMAQPRAAKPVGIGKKTPNLLKADLAKEDAILSSLQSALAQALPGTKRRRRLSNKIAAAEQRRARIAARLEPLPPEREQEERLARWAALEAKGEKFHAGSRKFEKNRLERSLLLEKIADHFLQHGMGATDRPQPWSQERVAVLTHFWAGGMSAATIGRKLGVSRNAVIGKAKRLGLPFTLQNADATDNREGDNGNI